MSIKSYITNNFGLKITALLLAFFVWAMISGKERSSSERTMEVSVEYVNASSKINVSSVRPEKVRLTVRGTSKVLDRMAPEDVKIKFDLKDVTEGTRLNYFTEDYLELPEGVQAVAVHPRMIEITVREFMEKIVTVRVRYKGNMQKGLKLIDRSVVPDKVKIFGYKSQITTINMIEGAEAVNLSELTESTSVKVLLKKEEGIVRFVDTDTVDVFINVKNTNKSKQDDEQGKPGNEN